MCERWSSKRRFALLGHADEPPRSAFRKSVGSDIDVLMSTGYSSHMRTTLTLDNDVAMAVKNYAHQNDMSFKETVNALLRKGLRRTIEPVVEGEIFPRSVNLGQEITQASLSSEIVFDDEVDRYLRVSAHSN